MPPALPPRWSALTWRRSIIRSSTKLAVAAPGMEGFAGPSPEADRQQLAGVTRAASIAATKFSHAQASENEAGKWQDSRESEMAAMWTRRDFDGHEMLSAGRFPLAQWAK